MVKIQRYVSDGEDTQIEVQVQIQSGSYGSFIIIML